MKTRSQIHLKLGFQTPEAAALGRRDFWKRRSDRTKKPTLIPPNMATPEIRAMVKPFNGWEETPGAVGWKIEGKMKQIFSKMML